MTALEFWKAFSEKVMNKDSCDRKALCENWTQSGNFTNIISKIIKNIIEDGYENGNITVQPEYLRIDIPAWQSNNDSNCEFVDIAPNFKKYDWNLKIAVEHENDYRLWMDEVVKLAHISCPLRIVIGYVQAESDREKTANKQERILHSVAEILNNDIDAWKTVISTNKDNKSEFLIVLGDVKVNVEERCHYTPYFYSFDKNEFVNLNDYMEEQKQ